jgi:hypothetical protein
VYIQVLPVYRKQNIQYFYYGIFLDKAVYVRIFYKAAHRAFCYRVGV